MPKEEWSGERIVWQNPREHLKEFQQCLNYYMEAMQYAKDKVVSDAACGTGFGSLLLSLVAERVLAYDIRGPFDIPSHSASNIYFTERDFDKEVMGHTSDLTVSIETIEHLADPDFFLSQLPSPALFFTIPCYGDKNPYHKIQYSEENAKALITKYFPNLTYRMERRRMIGYAIK